MEPVVVCSPTLPPYSPYVDLDWSSRDLQCTVPGAPALKVGL